MIRQLLAANQNRANHVSHLNKLCRYICFVVSFLMHHFWCIHFIKLRISLMSVIKHSKYFMYFEVHFTKKFQKTFVFYYIYIAFLKRKQSSLISKEAIRALRSYEKRLLLSCCSFQNFGKLTRFTETGWNDTKIFHYILVSIKYRKCKTNDIHLQ